MEPREITSIIQNLIQRDLLALHVSKDEEGKFTEYMNLNRFTKSYDILTQEKMKLHIIKRNKTLRNYFNILNSCFRDHYHHMKSKRSTNGLM